MADIFNFGGFLKKTLKRREDEAEPKTEQATETPENAQTSGTMSQGGFSYGPTGMQRKKKQQ